MFRSKRLRTHSPDMIVIPGGSLIGLALLSLCCRRSVEPPATPRSLPPAHSVTSESSRSLNPEPSPLPEPKTFSGAQPPEQLEPDGNDESEELGVGAAPNEGHFELVGQAPLALQRICDLTVHSGALYAAHAMSALGSDGATITRYQPGQRREFTVSFDWNRPGEPRRGGGAGQGFLRVRSLGSKLFVPDADPPYYGFWFSHGSPEGFVFVSTPEGKFAPTRRPGHLPPAVPTLSGGAGAAVLPGAYHVLDVIRFRGHYYASTGSVPRGGRANQAEAPGALHLANSELSRWEIAAEYPAPPTPGVTRLTFMVRYRDRLYAGVQDFQDQNGVDYVYWAPASDRTELDVDDLHAVRATRGGGAATYRWYADHGDLYWIMANRSGVSLLKTHDGDRWEHVPLPADVGAPTDVMRFGAGLFVLTERALLRIDEPVTRVIAKVETQRSPFTLSDYFCAAPLAIYRNQIYAGGQDNGRLYRLASVGPSGPQG